MPVLAKALYDNQGDTAEELSFHRGDVLTVLEKDAGGLQGWWVVSFKGKTGLAPGNRLKMLVGMHDAGSKNLNTTQMDKAVNWNRRSWLIDPNKVLTPKKVGDVYIYDQPEQDYDVPQSRYFTESSHLEKSPHNQHMNTSADIYDSPKSLKDSSSTYRSHTPVKQVPAHVYIENTYDSPQNITSNRSSTVSMLSTGSTATVSSSASNLSAHNQGSNSGSARSSGELNSQEIYDVPPATKYLHNHNKIADGTSPMAKLDMALETLEIYDTPPRQDRSVDSSMEVYDTPPRLNLNASKFKHSQSCNDDYDYATIPEDNSSRTSGDSGIETKLEVLDKSTPIPEEIYDTPPTRSTPPPPVLSPKKGTRSSLHALLSPKVVQDSIYDVPPQVSKDHSPSILRPKLRPTPRTSEIISDKDGRLSMSSEHSSSGSSDIPSVNYKELPLDVETATELLTNSQHDVQKATMQLLAFVTKSWRKRESLEPHLFDVKVSCIAVRTALDAFVEFGEGTVANSLKIQDKKLIKNLLKHLEPLQESLKLVDKSMKGLEQQKWLLSKLSMDTPDCGQNDDLGKIVDAARLLPEQTRALATIINVNCSLLFGKSDKRESPPKDISSNKKVKPERPPPPLKPKPKLTQSVSVDDEKKVHRRSSSIQERPLPSPPLQTLPSRKSAESLHDMSNHKDSRRSYSPSKTLEQSSNLRNRTNSDYDNNWGNAPQYDDEYVALATDSKCEDSRNMRIDSTCDSKSIKHSSGLTPQFKKELQRLGVNTSRETTPEQIYDMPPQGSRIVPGYNSQLLDENDRQLLSFYLDHMGNHSSILVKCIDVFFAKMKENPPPKIFVEYIKNVILAGQKLVYICDTIVRNIGNQEIREKVMICASALCECLKHTHTATKNAARQYPSIIVVQEMMDKLVDVSHASNEVKLVVTQAAQL